MTIADLPPITKDPVIEAYKRDVDRTLLRENLRRTPAERAADMAATLSEGWRMRQAILRQERVRRAARRESDATRPEARLGERHAAG